MNQTLCSCATLMGSVFKFSIIKEEETEKIKIRQKQNKQTKNPLPTVLPRGAGDWTQTPYAWYKACTLPAELSPALHFEDYLYFCGTGIEAVSSQSRSLTAWDGVSLLSEYCQLSLQPDNGVFSQTSQTECVGLFTLLNPSFKFASSLLTSLLFISL